MSENENRETVADIVEEMRNRNDLNGFDMVDNFHIDAEYGERGGWDALELIKAYADRIDAAWEREARAIATENAVLPAVSITKPSGNAAMMLEAMEKLDKLLFVGVDGYVHGQPDMTDEIERTIKSAISAPARNCDINLSAESLWDKFEDYMNDCGLPFYSEPSGRDAFDWLLATASERKGEN